MRARTTLRTALRSLWHHRLRSALTMLGITIGVAAVILMVAIGAGSEARIMEQITKLGSNMLVISPGASNNSGARLGAGTRMTLTEADLELVERDAPSVAAAGAVWWSGGQVVFGNRNWSARIHGVTPGFLEARTWEIRRGRALGDSDTRDLAKVALLGQTVVDRVFGDEEPLGQVIRLKNVPFVVVGILEKKGQSLQGSDHDDIVYVPLSTARFRLSTIPTAEVKPVSAIAGRARYLNPGEIPTDQLQLPQRKVLNAAVVHQRNVHMITARAWDGVSALKAEDEIRAVLRQAHGLHGDQPDDFVIRNLADVARAQSESARTMTLLLAGIAALSMLIGGIGIMNIMLVSVTERTPEIGLRMAIGARRADILGQFLLEASALALASGIIGIAIGILGAGLIEAFTNLSTLIDISAMALAFASAAAVGIVFGFYPAWIAAKLDAIVALRHA